MIMMPENEIAVYTRDSGDIVSNVSNAQFPSTSESLDVS